MNREKIKMLILLSNNVEEADAVLNRKGFASVKEKIVYLEGMFDFTIIGRQDKVLSEEASDRMDYYAILSAILNSEWEG